MPVIFGPPSKSYPPYDYTESLLAPPGEDTGAVFTTDSTTVYLVLAWLAAFLLIEAYLVILPRFRCKLHDAGAALSCQAAETKVDESLTAWKEKGLSEGRRDSDIERGLPSEFSFQYSSGGDYCTIVMPIEVGDSVCLQLEKQDIKAENANQIPSR